MSVALKKSMDSGFQPGMFWPGNLPDDWRVKRLKFVVRLVSAKAAYGDSELPYMGLEHIESWTGRYLEDEEASPDGVVSHFEHGDVLFGKLRPYLAKVHLARHRGVCSTEALVLRTSEELLPEYLRYFLVAPVTIENINSSTYGSKMPRASWDFIGNQLQPLPPLKQQQKIAAFLDRKTAEIDTLIDKKRRLLDRLAEKRTALITRAVTKGLNPDAPMKDSGIEWLGEIPAHWVVRKMKYLLEEPLKYGANEAATFDDPDWPRFIRITDVRSDGTLRDETFRSIPPEAASGYLLEPGDILFARSGATVGKTFQYQSEWGTSAFAGYLIRARFMGKLNYKYYQLFFSSYPYWEWIRNIFIQSTIQNVSAEKYGNMMVPLPPQAEQDEITGYVLSESEELKKVSSKVEQAIRSLEEYRSALITNAVTGQIKVA